MRNLIGVIIPTEWEVNFPDAVREFLDRFEVIRKVIPYDRDGTIYHLQNIRFPEVSPGSYIQVLMPKIVTGEYLTVIYI